MDYEPHLAFFREAFALYTDEDREALKKVVKVPTHLGPMNLGPVWFFSTEEGIRYMLEHFPGSVGIVYYIKKDTKTGKLNMASKSINLGEGFTPKEIL